jgi:RNA-directed DNA polymerase
MKAVAFHTDQKWVLLYVRRWLGAPLQRPDGTLVGRDRGTPQGSAISPLLANLFLHYAFDRWLRRRIPSVPFERYADDAVVHCASKEQAVQVRDAIAARMAEVGLQLHPDKTRVVFCKQNGRAGSYEHERFDFLGYTFRPRLVKSQAGRFFVGFTPAVSDGAAKSMRCVIRRWRLHQRSNKELADLVVFINPIVRGWINYYGRFYRSRLIRVLNRINDYLIRWAMRKYKRLRRSRRQAIQLLAKIARSQPGLFVHWQLVRPSWAG